MAWAVTTEGERIFLREIVLVKYEKSGQSFTVHIMITVCVNTISMSCDLP